MSFLNITRKTPNWNAIQFGFGAFEVNNFTLCSFGNYGSYALLPQDLCSMSGGTIINALGNFPGPWVGGIFTGDPIFFLDIYGAPLAKPFSQCGASVNDGAASNPYGNNFFQPNSLAGISWNSSWVTDWKSPDGWKNILKYFNNFQSTNNFVFPTLVGPSNEVSLTDDTTSTRRLSTIQTGSCCYWSETETTWQQKCADVNSEHECYLLNKEASKNGFKYRFWPGYGSSDTNCIPVVLNKETRKNIESCNPDIDGCYNSEDIIGNCYRQNGVCSISTKASCADGYWVGPDKNKNIKKCTENVTVYFPIVSTGITTNRQDKISTQIKIQDITSQIDSEFIAYTPGVVVNKTKLSDLETSTDSVSKLPGIGRNYQGGLYVGVFTAGNKQNAGGSSIFGNPKSGKAKIYNARNTGLGTKETSWILIAAPSDLGEFEINYDGPVITKNNLLLKTTTPQSIETSFSDGFYNTYLSDASYKTSLYSQIKTININGFTDWYIPSQDEWALYAQNIEKDFKIKTNVSFIGSYFEPLAYDTYWSSTSTNIVLNSTYYNYGFCNNTGLPYGSTVLENRKNKLGVRLFRRIYVY